MGHPPKRLRARRGLGLAFGAVLHYTNGSPNPSRSEGLGNKQAEPLWATSDSAASIVETRNRALFRFAHPRLKARAGRAVRMQTKEDSARPQAEPGQSRREGRIVKSRPSHKPKARRILRRLSSSELWPPPRPGERRRNLPRRAARSCHPAPWSQAHRSWRNRW
jgi:hypothetical protein